MTENLTFYLYLGFGFFGALVGVALCLSNLDRNRDLSIIAAAITFSSAVYCLMGMLIVALVFEGEVKGGVMPAMALGAGSMLTGILRGVLTRNVLAEPGVTIESLILKLVMPEIFAIGGLIYFLMVYFVY